MIELPLYLSFIAITIGLVLTPGPNFMLIISNALALGPRRGLLTVAGTASACVIQLAVAATAVTSITLLLADLFEWLRWIGVAYLVYLGLQQFRPAKKQSNEPAARVSRRTTYAQGFFVGLTNPKTMLFFVAFLPQFVVADRSIPLQLLTLSATFVTLAAIGDGSVALLAGHLRNVTETKWRRPLTGCLYLTAGIGLALARRSA